MFRLFISVVHYNHLDCFNRGLNADLPIYFMVGSTRPYFKLTMLFLDRMGFDGLARYLMSEDNLILKKEYLHEEHDLSFPLSQYYIHSSHNTYLIGK